MSERRPEAPPEQPATPPSPADTGYTEEEEAEVQKRLEDLGYVE
ncbi:MAG TPA: hypothetical protein VMS22_16580 [Candidatus Eisenbacteria bacterium]|nr:hypothetical protein [Candidatus Eisenbacteria bacterium]